MSQRNNTLNARLAGYATLAGVTLAGGAINNAEAVIIYSGVVNINVPSNIDGVYINFVTGATATANFAGADFNPYNNGTTLAFFGTGGTVNGTLSTATATNSPTLRLNMGDLIGAAGAYVTGQSVGSAFTSGGQGYVGVRFVNEALGGITNFGWVLLSTTSGSSGFPVTVVSWAYENSGGSIAAGAIPEPSTTALLGVMAAGAFGVRQWRRRKAAK
jgi:hypothetical protein